MGLRIKQRKRIPDNLFIGIPAECYEHMVVAIAALPVSLSGVAVSALVVAPVS